MNGTRVSNNLLLVLKGEKTSVMLFLPCRQKTIHKTTLSVKFCNYKPANNGTIHNI